MELPTESSLAPIETALSQPLLVPAREAAKLCGKTTRTWRSWDAAGWVPRPIRIARSTLWSVAELHAWVEAGCPRREVWERTGKKSAKST